MNILIIEDTKYLADAVAHVLKREHHSVDIAYDSTTGLQYARSGVYDVIVLDNMLPKLSGVEVTRTLRNEHFETAIILLSAKSEVDDKIEGLDAGADDYLAKPFKIDELLARIQALTRRHENHLNDKNITLGNIVLYRDTAMVAVGSKEASLTAKELALLEMLILNVNKIINKEVLFRRVWGQERFIEVGYVNVYISYLRKKLESIGANVQINMTRGLGYTLVIKVE